MIEQNVRYQVWELIRTRAQGQTGNRVRYPAWNQVVDLVWKRVYEQSGDSLRCNIWDQMMNEQS